MIYVSFLLIDIYLQENVKEKAAVFPTVSAKSQISVHKKSWWAKKSGSGVSYCCTCIKSNAAVLGKCWKEGENATLSGNKQCIMS